ncbi:MAG: guanylate kinase [Bacteroidetes bacterium]|nr:MAG: guanylate kinase [Bacteroidota bacterium]
MPAGTLPKGQGRAIIFSAPSGAGKTTMVKSLMESANLSLGFSISATTRPIRGDEVDGAAYYYLSQEEFDRKVANNEFVEWEEVYPGLCYGTLCREVERLWAKGKTPVFDVDVIGGKTLKKVFGDASLSIFVMPPSMEVLEQRLRGRGTENEKNVVRRLAKAGKELLEADNFDVKIINNDLEIAKAETERVVIEFLNK